MFKTEIQTGSAYINMGYECIDIQDIASDLRESMLGELDFREAAWTKGWAKGGKRWENPPGKPEEDQILEMVGN